MPELSFELFLNRVRKAVAGKEPFAHIRYGDGEGIVMGYPEYTGKEKAMGRWSKWLGENGVDMSAFALLIRDTVKDADIVGLPCKRHMTVNQDWRNVRQFMERYGLINRDSVTCCMDWTVKMQTDGHYKALLRGRDSVYLITCRDVSEAVKRGYGVTEVRPFYLPVQHRPCVGNSVSVYSRHYPEAYHTAIEWIRENAGAGRLFLVGAGGLGKIYCSEIKRAGGIALDVGSLFDGWAGHVTRSYLKNIKDFAV